MSLSNDRLFRNAARSITRAKPQRVVIDAAEFLPTKSDQATVTTTTGKWRPKFRRRMTAKAQRRRWFRHHNQLAKARALRAAKHDEDGGKDLAE